MKTQHAHFKTLTIPSDCPQNAQKTSLNGLTRQLVSSGKPYTKMTAHNEVGVSPYMSPSQQPYSEEETAVFSKFTPPVACKLKKPLVSQSTSSMLFKKHVSSETAKTATPDLSDKIFLHATTPQVVDMRSPQVEEESSDDIFKSEQSQSDLLDESEMIAFFQLKMRHHA